VFLLAGPNGRYYFLPRDFRYENEESIEKSGMDQDRFQSWFYDTCESGSLTSSHVLGSGLGESAANLAV
jgi:hypothetical protein